MTNLDIRFPIGLLFSILGVVLTLFGLMSDPALYQRSLGININLWWGLVMLLAGGVMLFLSRKTISGTSRNRT
jgi:hypothetical protein